MTTTGVDQTTGTREATPDIGPAADGSGTPTNEDQSAGNRVNAASDAPGAHGVLTAGGTRTADPREFTGPREVAAPEVVPFGWEPARPGAATGLEDEALFRFPAADDPAPGTRRLLGMSIYAALLGLGGVGVGVRGLLSQIGGGVPGWYTWVLAFLGMVSVALAVGAFLSIHRRVLPLALLGAAAVPLTADLLLAVAY
ncbi:hypothetical protein AB0J80_18325 [Actinoplanes sp. NPDC049548]|uniref:hypothetical protein n=1 Tax=Actinoplanes sp. NPDC049548 TaxID=3155152 RepID=UPI003444D2D1